MQTELSQKIWPKFSSLEYYEMGWDGKWKWRMTFFTSFFWLILGLWVNLAHWWLQSGSQILYYPTTSALTPLVLISIFLSMSIFIFKISLIIITMIYFKIFYDMIYNLNKINENRIIGSSKNWNIIENNLNKNENN